MPGPLVRTKLYIPPVRSSQVRRQRLNDQVRPDPHVPLTLVSAPPGFGKTTLLAAIAETAVSAGRSVAWVSLEASEQQPEAFWSYVVAALDPVVPGLRAKTLPLLEATNPVIETAISTVLNELSSQDRGIDLVLDDFHLAESPAVADQLSFFVEHLPAQVRLTIGTRSDPGLPLARLRARGELVEVRAADLRFTLAEVATYLNDSLDLGLGADDVRVLESRTEGWIAALQLAALSIRGREDVAGFIAGFAGDDRYVVDYLVEEVLARQPDDVRTFLLETSILDRLSGPLCDAVTGRTDSAALLETLNRANLFVVALDDSRHWYRYHHLFGEVLRVHLRSDLPERVPDLHRRAARWYDDVGDPVQAFRHAVASGDLELAADLAERSVIGLLRDRQEPTVRRWIDDIPHEIVRRRPVLAVGFIGALMSNGQFESVPDRLDEVELLLAGPTTDLTVLEESELLRLPGAIWTYRAALALVAGDPMSTIAHAQTAIDRAAPGDDLTLAAASALSGLASWACGDLETAHQRYSLAVGGLRRAGNYSDVLGCSITLADLRITQGRLGDAVRACEDALRLAEQHQGETVLRGTADMLVGLSQVALERDDLAAAAAFLERAEELGEHNGLPQNPYRSRAARARLLEAEGDWLGAVALLEDAERVYVGDFSPNVRPVPAQRARILVAHGRLSEAVAWARDQHLEADDELSYVREYEHLTLARILIQQQAAAPTADLRTAQDLLDRLLDATEQGGRTGTAIEVLALQALAHHAAHGRHDLPAALAPLERALALAEPEGYARVFAGEGPSMTLLLEALVRKHPSWDYPRRLLGTTDPAAAPASRSPELPDQLSARELDVLRLLGGDLSGPAIARELVVSVNTLRSHTKSIYAKLGVTSRRAAVSRARELHLVPGPH